MRTPDHYDYNIQPVDFILANNIPFCEGNVIKYICRWTMKNGREDLLKARHYIDMLIESLDSDCYKAYADTTSENPALWDPTSGPTT